MEILNWDPALDKLRKTIAENPTIYKLAQELPELYKGKRGLMVVDVVASRQRRYEKYVVAKLLPMYIDQAEDLSLACLAANVPDWLPLKDQEAQTMSTVASNILDFGRAHGLVDEDTMANSWAQDLEAIELMKQVFGIGPALVEYLRMLSGSDSLKVDVRVINGFEALGLPVHLFSPDGILELAKQLSRKVPCSLIELDQCLWHILGS
jgi:hypothetical protein